MVSLVTLAGSMAPLNGIVTRGWVEKPSSSLITAMSAHSAALAGVLMQSAGTGRLTRRNVLLPNSRTGKRSLGNGVAVGSLPLNRTDTPALALTARPANAAASASRLKANANDMLVSVVVDENSGTLGRSDDINKTVVLPPRANPGMAMHDRDAAN